MTGLEVVMDEKKGGRPRRQIPRVAKRVYMTEATRQQIRHWQACRVRDGKEVGFSDAVGEMLDCASVYAVDVRPAHNIVPVSQVMGDLWRRRRCTWIRINPNTGRTLKCIRCGTVQDVESARFSGILRAVNSFVERHCRCRGFEG